MDWLGIGVLVIGVAFAVLVGILIKPINKLADVLDGVKETTDRLPETMDDLTGHTKEIMRTSNATIETVNDQLKEFNPLLHTIGDVGGTVRQKTLAALGKTSTLKAQTEHAAEFTKQEKYEGIYGLLSFYYFMTRRKKKRKSV